jgi:nucleotide-binding universal stress UspA family protein
MKTGPVIVASDFSPAADEAIRQAHERALATEQRLMVVHVVPRSIQMHAFFPQVNPLAIDDILERQKALGPKLVERVSSLTGRAEADFDVALEAGEPYLEIVSKAEDLGASLIVVGNHGASGFDRILLGSVSETPGTTTLPSSTYDAPPPTGSSSRIGTR